MKYYVRMTDKLMSEWGQARGKASVLVVVCETMEQAEVIERAANDRPEMKYVGILLDMPKTRKNQRVDVKQYAEMTGSWKKYERKRL